MDRSRYVVSASLCAAVAIATCSIASAAPAVGSRSLSASFESGGLAVLSGHSHATVTPAAACHGKLGLRVAPTASVGFGKWNSPKLRQGYGYWSVRAYVRVDSWHANQAVALITVENSRHAHNFDLFVTQSSRFFRWDLVNYNNATSRLRVKLNTWYLIQARGSFGASGSYHASVSINGVQEGSIVSRHQPRATVTGLLLGSPGNISTNVKELKKVK
jgi:hypothetical protein